MAYPTIPERASDVQRRILSAGGPQLVQRDKEIVQDAIRLALIAASNSLGTQAVKHRADRTWEAALRFAQQHILDMAS